MTHPASTPRRPEGTAAEHLRERRTATAREAKALSHPLRLRILRLCRQHELTNKQLADHLNKDPGTVLYHVRQLVGAGLLGQAEVRTGESGALEKPYRTTMNTWWLSTQPFSAATDADSATAPLDAFWEELQETGPDSVRTYAKFMLHLSPEDIAAVDRRICAIIDEYVETEDTRLDQPSYGGIFALHQLGE